MRKTSFFLLLLMMATACSQRKTTDTPTATSTQVADTLRTEVIHHEQENAFGHCEISIDWPVAGPAALLSSLREYIVTSMFDGGYSSLPTHPDSLVTLWSERKLASFEKSLSDMKIRVNSPDEAPEEGVKIVKAWENDKLVTYEVSGFSYFTGGGRGTFGTRGATFRKRDGHRYGGEILKNADEHLHALMLVGLMRFFEVTDTNALKQKLTIAPDMLPMPAYPPYLLADGLRFQYNVYDICRFDDGDPWFSIDWEDIKPYLNVEASP
ncbi:MAG: hypothetical protein IKX22_05225 [Prevotella sp.]|nr:hypothetical protein [Prevotella sp.]